VIAQPVRDSINAIWLRNNLHWNELTDQNTLTQMLGTGKPTQHEYLGCLIGHMVGDTVYVTDWRPAQHMHQWQFAVTGDCKHVAHLVGTWHTHPYRADSANHPLKEPVLSSTDLSTFAKGTDQVVLGVGCRLDRRGGARCRWQRAAPRPGRDHVALNAPSSYALAKIS